MTYLPDKTSLDARALPWWYRDAKLGIFVHWGLYSIPAFAERTQGNTPTFMSDLTAGKDTQGNSPYAEWYLNGLRVPGSPVALHHAANYGKEFSYFDFRKQFNRNAAAVDFDQWAELFAAVGARYVVMVTKHEDGFPMWPTRIANPHMPADYKASRDLVGDLAGAVRARGLRMGLYYAGGVDWTFKDTPIRTIADLMEHEALGSQYARYAAAHWRELIDDYQPSVLWNDMGWPAEQDPNKIIAHFYNSVEDGVVNDRWTQVKLPRNRLARALYLRSVLALLKVMTRAGREIPKQTPTFHYDIQTYEYSYPDTTTTAAWELCRGLGNSFGYNAQETANDMLSGAQLIHLLADVVSKGGNLLINVGPDGTGQIPPQQQQPLRELGTWLATNGEAIFGTRSWTQSTATTAQAQPVRFTHKDGTVYAIILADRLGGRLLVRDLTLPPGSRVGLLGENGDVDWGQEGSDTQITVPPQLPRQPAHVLTIAKPA